MKKKTALLATEEDILVDLTFHSVPASLIAEYTEKIAKPHYNGNLNTAIQDLIHKTHADEDTALSHITHIKTTNQSLNQNPQPKRQPNQETQLTHSNPATRSP